MEPNRVGFIGLGIMGAPMAKNMLSAAADLLVHDIDPQAVANLTQAGAVAGSPEEIASACRIVFLMLPGGSAVEEVLFGEKGIAAKMSRGSLVCDMTTAALHETRSFAERLAQCGVRFIDAPVSGGEAKAVSGDLAIMAGGDVGQFQTVLPYLQAVGADITLVGPNGSGCAAKLVNQILVHVTMAGICEAYALAEKLGMNLEKVYNAIGTGSASSAMLHSRTAKIIDRDFTAGAKISIVHKDIRNVLAASADVDMPLPLTGTVFSLLQAARAAHFQNHDVTRLLTVYEGLGGVDSQG